MTEADLLLIARWNRRTASSFTKAKPVIVHHPALVHDHVALSVIYEQNGIHLVCREPNPAANRFDHRITTDARDFSMESATFEFDVAELVKSFDR